MHFLAIDLGTESARAAVYSGDGAFLSTGTAEYSTEFFQPGWAEQDPVAWRAAMVAACRTALAHAGVDSVEGICLATTASSVVFLDAANMPTRPALLWMDTRAHREAADTAQSSHPNLAFSGGVDSPEWLVPKAMWVRKNQPEIFAASARIGEAVDYLTLQLTGQWVGSQLNATCKWNYDPRVGELPHDLYEELGVPELATKLPADVRPVGTPVGTVTTQMAAELGLANLPVVSVGGIDAHVALIGLRALSESAVSIAAGTSNAFITETALPFESKEIWGPYPHALTPGRWLAEGGQLATGSSIAWVAEKVLGHSREQQVGLIERAQRRGPTSHGLIVMDDFMGNRTPYRDASMRGGILGLSLSTSPEDIYLATVEGVAFGTKHVLNSFSSVGIDTGNLYFSGGIKHNPLWLQTTANAIGYPINVVGAGNLTLLSTAAAAAVGSGAIAGWAAAEQVFRPETICVEPEREAADILAERFELFVRFKDINQPIFRSVTDAGKDA